MQRVSSMAAYLLLLIISIFTLVAYDPEDDKNYIDYKTTTKLAEWPATLSTKEP